MNSSIKVRNSPMLPSRVAQSQNVGMYIFQLEGTKSRAKLVTTMTNRSTHIPTLAESATRNSAISFVRIFRDHSSCGSTQLSVINTQNTQPYGPKARLRIIDISKTSPLYQAMNASMM